MTYVPVDQSQLMLSVIVLAPLTTVNIGDLMKGTYYIVTVYANNSVGRSPDSNSVITRTDIDCKLVYYNPFCLHYASIKLFHVSIKSLYVSILSDIYFQFVNIIGIN